MVKNSDFGWTLNTGQKMNLGLSAFSDFMSAFSAYSSAKLTQESYNFQARQNEINSALLMQDANDTFREYGNYENQVREQALKTRGAQRTAMGASGFEVTSKSYDNLINKTDRRLAENIAAIKTSAISKFATQRMYSQLSGIQADLYREAGAQAKKQAKSSAVISGLTGALKLGALSYFGVGNSIGGYSADSRLQSNG